MLIERDMTEFRIEGVGRMAPRADEPQALTPVAAQADWRMAVMPRLQAREEQLPQRSS